MQDYLSGSVQMQAILCVFEDVFDEDGMNALQCLLLRHLTLSGLHMSSVGGEAFDHNASFQAVGQRLNKEISLQPFGRGK